MQPQTYLFIDKQNIVKMVSHQKLITNRYKVVSYPHYISPAEATLLIGKTVKFGSNKNQPVRLALLANWSDLCGISTYTKFLIDTLAPKLDSLKIFSEDRGQDKSISDGYDVEYSWTRGKSMIETIKKIIAWKPTIVLIQHEFGIFPKANYFLPMMGLLAEAKIPTVTTLHSVYEHLDKSVCTSAMKNVIVHSVSAQNCLRNTLNHKDQQSWVIPHGCIDFGNVEPLWNFYGVPYPLIQFGFGFSYKGVDIALEAIASLKKKNDKFKDIFYCYLCSESEHAKNIHADYYRKINQKIIDLGLEDNATIQRGFFTEDELNNYLRTSRCAIFPYLTDKKNVVFGASGAVRISMANNVPVIASASNMFDDLEGVLPRPFGAEALASEIEKVFTNETYKNELLAKQRKYIIDNSWKVTAQRYYDVLKELVDAQNKNVIYI